MFFFFSFFDAFSVGHCLWAQEVFPALWRLRTKCIPIESMEIYFRTSKSRNFNKIANIVVTAMPHCCVKRFFQTKFYLWEKAMASTTSNENFYFHSIFSTTKYKKLFRSVTNKKGIVERENTYILVFGRIGSGVLAENFIRYGFRMQASSEVWSYSLREFNIPLFGFSNAKRRQERQTSFAPNRTVIII